MRWLLFLGAVLVIVCSVGAAAYYTAGYWLVPVLGNTQAPGTERLAKLIAVVPSALAALMAALISGVVALLVAGYQRRAGKDLETLKNKFTGELEDQKSKLAKSLEDHKDGLAREMKEYEDQLKAGRARLDADALKLAKARELVSTYRVAIGRVREGTFDLKEVTPLESRLVALRDELLKDGPLYKPWCNFMQAGDFLTERAKKLTKATGQRKMSREFHPDHPSLTLSQVFAQTAERVLSVINDEDERLRTAEPRGR